LEKYREDEQELEKPTSLMEFWVRQWGGKTGRDQLVHCHHYWRRRRALNGHSGVEDGGFGAPVRGQKGEEREGGVKVERPEPDIDSKRFGRNRRAKRAGGMETGIQNCGWWWGGLLVG